MSDYEFAPDSHNPRSVEGFHVPIEDSKSQELLRGSLPFLKYVLESRRPHLGVLADKPHVISAESGGRPTWFIGMDNINAYMSMQGSDEEHGVFQALVQPVDDKNSKLVPASADDIEAIALCVAASSKAWTEDRSTYEMTTRPDRQKKRVVKKIAAVFQRIN